jgi:hypothetical protein
MSLLITEQRDGNISDKPYSYRNNISNGFIVEPNSEIALINSTINRGGSFNISKDRKLFVFWGNPLPIDEAYYKDDQGNTTDDAIPPEKERCTKDIPWEVIIPKGVYTTSQFTGIVEDSLNRQCPHPAFGNLETRFGASADTDGHFKCELKLNSVNEFKGFKISIASETYDHNSATTYPNDQVEVLARDGAGGGYNNGVLTTPMNTKLSIMFNFKQPIHPSEGGFKFTIPAGGFSNKWVIGLVRNNNKGEYMPYDKDGAPNYNYGAITDQFGNDYNDDIFNDYGGDFFDYCLVCNGTDIRLWYLEYDEQNDMYQMDELEYWDTATYKGSSGFQSVALSSAYNGANTDIDFYIQHENIIIEIANTKITNKQLPAVGSSNYSLYPKAILSNFYMNGVTIRPSSRIIGWDSTKDLSYKWWYDPLQHELLRRSDYWRTQYVKHIIFSMYEESDEVPAGVWITDYRTAITKTQAQVHNIDFNSTQRIVLISGDMTGIRYNVDGNIQGFLGFERVEDEPDTETTTLLKYQTKMDRLPEVNSNNAVHVRINDLEMRTLNGITSSFSRIVGSVPRHIGAGNVSSGLKYHEPSNLIFLDLHNKEKMIINSIQVDMVNSNETFAADLQDYTSNTFLIRKKNKNIIN